MDNQTSILLILRPLLEKNKHLNAALYHKSAKSESIQFLSNYGCDTAILGHWESFGKATLSLYTCRLTINLPMKKSSAVCSGQLQSLKKQLLIQLVKAIKKSNISNFGPSFTNADQNQDENYFTIAYQLIGAITQTYGYNSVVSELLVKVLNLGELKITASKDSKTTLQEYTQKRFRKMPSYTLVDSDGPAHEKIFRAKVEVNGQVYFGDGKSKKSAEHESAIAYIKSNKIPWSNEISVDLNVNIDYYNTIKNIKLGKASFTEFLNTYMLPLWSEPLFALVHIHRSFGRSKELTILGENNTLLGFIGAYLIQWVAHDAILGSMKTQEITEAGGITVVTSLLVSRQKLEYIFDSLFSNNQIKIGRGEKNIHSAMKTDFVQAFCGAVFLIRESELCKAKDFFHGILPLHQYFNEDTDRLRVSREESLSIKTILQEQCQSLGIKIEFETKTEKNHSNKQHVTPFIYLQSDRVLDNLCIEGDTEYKEAHSRKKILN